MRLSKNYMRKNLLEYSKNDLDAKAARLQAKADEIGTSNEFDYNYLLFLKETVLRAKAIKQVRENTFP